MSKLAVVFPGQGSQSVGMGRELAERYDVVRETMAEADDVLGFSLSELCYGGPDAELTRTENTQPALLAVSVAIQRLLASRGFAPDAAAGHSLGEYSALVCAEALTLADALRTVRRRGRLMEAAVPAGRGGMAAVLGLSDDEVNDLCASTPGLLEPATFNAPGQVVVAGETDAIDALVAGAKEAGARRAQRLNVSGPFHSSLLSGAGEALAGTLAEVQVRPPKIPVYSNVTARVQTTEAEIRDNLARQVSSPVRWVESVEAMVSDGVETFVEVGPGRVLSGLIKRIHRPARTFNVESDETFSRLMQFLEEDAGE